ncbi:MAG: undecaprenyldiphospho-muramoylpentapeptide beta-N-acetylglucosaminyltransferase [Myxococcota bacterium]|nr:undecaprenyldiphospho-muramoylpentapeptide beta-N-acetylglucosaminyltransferase [Myxococcota bacterium]
MSKDSGITVLIAGGGTGGHFFSGVAVGEAFLARAAGNRVVYVGTEQGIEARIAPRNGLDLRFISIAGVRGKGLLRKIGAVLRIPLAMLQSARIILKERPKIVLGVGGYASGPVVLAARLMGKMTGVVEQNSVAGTTNKILGRFVHRVFVAFERARADFPSQKVRFTGNPIREEVVQLLTLESTATVGLGDRFKILVVGGSQGARSINASMSEMLDHISEEMLRRLYVVHQTGKADEEKVRAAYEAKGVDGRVVPFIHEMAEAYRSADLVVCRAGALTISELTVSRRGSLLIPYPHAVDDHQRHNAQALVDAGAGEMLLEADLSGKVLAEAIDRLGRDRKGIQNMAWSAGSLAKPQAATEVCDEMCRVAGLP